MYRLDQIPRLVALALLCALTPKIHAQIQVRMEIPRHLYLCYEPMIATVQITNLAGRDITLADQAPNQWFSFEILKGDGTPIPPRVEAVHLHPLTIPVGATVERQVNLVSLYPITDYGKYSVRASVYFAPLDKYFSSNEAPVEVTEGTQMWQQTVGIPDGQKDAGQYRSYELLSFRQDKDNLLYVRVEDKDGGAVYGTQPLGRLVNGYDPDVQIDALSELHILQMIAPKEYLYTRMGPDGEVLGQEDYADLKTRPYLKRTAEGDVAVAGGMHVEAKTAEEAAAGPKLSDRPAGMPAQ
jgi:hypothetical protein